MKKYHQLLETASRNGRDKHLIFHGISICILLVGILSLYRPILLLYLFSTLPIISYMPFIAPEDSTLRLLRIGSINLFAQDYLVLLMAVLLAGLLIYHFISNHYYLRLVYQSPISKMIIVLFTWEIFIGMLSYMKGFDLQNVLRRLAVESLVFIAILLPLIPRVHQAKKRFFNYLIIIGLCLSAIGLWRYALGHNIELTSSFTRRTLLGNTVVIFMFPICYILFCNPSPIKNKIGMTILILFLLFGINFTGHRSGYFVFLFVFGRWMIQKDFLTKKLIWLPLWGVAATITILLVLPFYIKSASHLEPGRSLLGDVAIRYRDTFNLDNTTTAERLSKWQYAAEVAIESPLLGLGRFPYYSSYQKEDGMKFTDSFAELNRAPHNLFANKIMHQGIAGLSLLVIFFVISLYQIKKAHHRDPSYNHFLSTYILSFILFSFFNTAYGSAFAKAYFFIAIGFAHTEIIALKLRSIEPMAYQGTEALHPQVSQTI